MLSGRDWPSVEIETKPLPKCGIRWSAVISEKFLLRVQEWESVKPSPRAANSVVGTPSAVRRPVNDSRKTRYDWVALLELS